MADSITTVQQDSKERVAFDLMDKISGWEDSDKHNKNREYFLRLYRQCYRAANGSSLEAILKGE
jgi:hypothetical protein